MSSEDAKELSTANCISEKNDFEKLLEIKTYSDEEKVKRIYC